MGELRAHLPRPATAIALALAAVFSIPNFLYPLFEDTALYAAIGHWMRDGMMPYRDLVEQKPPGMYWLTYLTDVLLGRSSFATRLVELAAIFTMAAACARIGRRLAGDAAVAPAIFIAVALSSSLFWGVAERGQVEWFQAAITAWGVVFAIESIYRPHWHTAWLAGLLLGLACWFKPQGALVAIGVGGVLVARLGANGDWKRAARTAGHLVAGAATVSALFIGWMLAVGIFDEFLHQMFVTNTQYLEQTERPSLGEAYEVLTKWPWVSGLAFAALYALTIGGVVSFFAPRDGRRDRAFAGAIILVWLVAAFAQYYSGRYLFRYHKVIMVPPMAVILTCGFTGMWAVVTHYTTGKVEPRLRTALLFVVTGALAVTLGMNDKYKSEWEVAGDWAFGDTSTEEVQSRYGKRLHYYHYPTQRRLAEHVKQRTGPDDHVMMIGRGGVFYLYADRRPATRYLVTKWVFNKKRTDYEEHLDRLIANLEEHTPAFVVVRRDDEFPWFNQAASVVQVQNEPRMLEFLKAGYIVDGVFEGSAVLFRRRDIPK
jgi:hypothetical protein